MQALCGQLSPGSTTARVPSQPRQEPKRWSRRKVISHASRCACSKPRPAHLAHPCMRPQAEGAKRRQRPGPRNLASRAPPSHRPCASNASKRNLPTAARTGERTGRVGSQDLDWSAPSLLLPKPLRSPVARRYRWFMRRTAARVTDEMTNGLVLLMRLARQNLPRYRNSRSRRRGLCSP